ncbi:MAG: thiaminase II [Chloroflexi bacterium]|nr:thiaminase II [Chloroflexota bacterium]
MPLPFSEELRRDLDSVWERIFSHPFLKEVQAGTLPLEKFRYYVIQDYHYLEGFGRTVSIALSKGPDTETLRKLVRRVTTPIERPLHARMFELLEIEQEEVDRVGPSPTNLAYVNHMITTAASGGVGEAAAALLPCPWSYHELGNRLSLPDHPVYNAWVEAYHSGILEESTAAWRDLVDTFAEEGGPTVRESMRQAFLTSSRYEYLFWTMAYNMETWPS